MAIGDDIKTNSISTPKRLNHLNMLLLRNEKLLRDTRKSPY